MDNIYEESLIKQDTVLIIADASFKNNITTSVSHIWRGQEIIAKLVHHTSNVSSTEAKIFTIRCGINYAMKLQDISCIIVITDAIPAAKHLLIYILLQYQKTSKVFSTRALTIPSSFGIVLTPLSGHHSH